MLHDEVQRLIPRWRWSRRCQAQKGPYRVFMVCPARFSGDATADTIPGTTPL